MSTAHTLSKITHAVAVKEAELGLELRLGYIGNVWPNGADDRAWTVWIQGIFEYRTNNTLSLGFAYSPADLDRMADRILDGAIEQKLQWAFNGAGTGQYGVRDVQDAMLNVTMTAAQVEETLDTVLEKWLSK